MALPSLSHLLSKIGSVNPSTRSKAVEIVNAAQAAGHPVRFVWGKSSEGEHATGNALDIMVHDEAAGDWVRNYVWANRARLGLRHVIWEQHITSTVIQPGVRRLMADRGDTTKNHYDHNHILFNDDKSYVPPSVPKPPAPVKKPPVTKPVVKVRVLRRGMKGNDVKTLQKELRRVFPAYAGRLSVDGDFGPATEKAVKEFQGRSKLKKDGVVGPNTRLALKKNGVRL